MSAASGSVFGASAHDTLESFNPATGEPLGSVATVAPEDVAAIVDDVAEVQPFWAQLPLSDRARYMRRAAQVLIDQIDGLAAFVTREQGRPRSEAYAMELLPSIDALHWIATNGERTLADERISHTHPLLLQKRSILSYEPLGVIAVLTPAGNPWAAPFTLVATALMCGNGAVLKPAPETPLVGRQIQDAFERAGIPEGLVATIHGDDAVVDALVESNVAKVFYTGSARVGRRVARRCAELMKGSVLELGGNDPQLVLADAPLDHAVAGCAWAAFANSGQTRSGIERVYVMRDVAEPFVEGVVAVARALSVGDPMDWRTEIGPLPSSAQREHVARLVEEAVADGATLRCGGPVELAGLRGSFLAPAVLTGVRPDMRVMREQVPGPVVPILEVGSEEEAIAGANDSDFGLGASVWTLDREKGRRIAHRLEASTVWLNDHLYVHGAFQCSCGGIKRSGVGRVQSKFTFYECVAAKQIAWESPRVRNFYWHPYDETLGRGLSAAARLIYGRDADKRPALKDGAAPLAKLARKALGG